MIHNKRQLVNWKGQENVNASVAGLMRPTTGPVSTFGMPHPINHYRLGRDLNTSVGSRLSRSTRGGNLIKQMMDIPGGYSVSTIPSPNLNAVSVSTPFSMQNKGFLTDNPTKEVQTYTRCCNQEDKARRRTLPANTIIKPVTKYLTKDKYTDKDAFKKAPYYTSLQQQREANCETFEQNEYPTNMGCKCIVYKPNNKQYSNQGAVSSSARLLRLNVETITNSKFNSNTRKLCNHCDSRDTFILKNKVPVCTKTSPCVADMDPRKN
jgi:hypothetical protein